MTATATSRVHAGSRNAWRRHLGGDQLVRPSSLRRSLASGTVSTLAERALRSNGRRVLLDVDGHRATGNDLIAASGAVAGGLARSGLGRGERVLVSIPTSLDFVVAYLGVLRAGCSVILGNPALTRPELERLVETGTPARAIVSAPVREVLDDLVEAGTATDLTPASVMVSLGDGSRPDRRDSTVGRPASPGPGHEAVLAGTSGSTGDPKGVPLTHANLVSSIRAVMGAWRWSGSDVVVHCLPLYHQHGLGTINALALGGGRTVIKSRFDPEELTAAVRDERASMVLGVPAIYQKLVDAAPNREAFESLRLVVSGSAPLPPALFEQIEEVTGKTPLERYGTTESGLDVSNLYDGPRRPGSVGHALPGVEVRIGAGDDETPPGGDGEILVRGPQVFAGYVARDPAPETFSPGRWFRTGDIGRVDPDDGSIAITGRSKDVIISGGMNVHPREVELVLERHPQVAAVAVGGVPSDRWGEAVYAFIVPRPGHGPARNELMALCEQSLAPYKRPKRYVVVGDLPRNQMGKIVRKALPPLAAIGEMLD